MLQNRENRTTWKVGIPLKNPSGKFLPIALSNPWLTLLGQRQALSCQLHCGSGDLRNLGFFCLFLKEKNMGVVWELVVGMGYSERNIPILCRFSLKGNGDLNRAFKDSNGIGNGWKYGNLSLPSIAGQRWNLIQSTMYSLCPLTWREDTFFFILHRT